MPEECCDAAARECSTDVTAITRSPAARKPIAISIGTAVVPPALNTIAASVGRSRKLARIDAAKPLDALDRHRLPLAVRAHDLRVERHRQLDERREAGIRAVAREQLLDRDARVAGAEAVHEPAAADRVGADQARRLDRLGLAFEPFEQRARRGEVGVSLGAHRDRTLGGDAERERARRHGAQGDDAGHGADRPLLHAHAARRSATATACRSSTRAPRSARARSPRPRACPSGRPTSRPRSRTPTPTRSIVGLPNDLHEEVIRIAADAGKAVLCTKPLARTGAEAKRILDTVEGAGVFGGYLEDLAYTPKTLKALGMVKSGAIGDVTWARSRETHPGPHSAWFWDAKQAGGGPIVDLGCHCIEIVRNFIGKGNRPVEVMCWADTLVHPIEAEDNAIALIRFESGAIGQFEVSWTFRGGMDLRDEVAGTEGTIWLDHFLRTGFEAFSSGEGGDYVAEKAETSSGWLFPVGDEIARARLRRHVHRHVRRDGRGPRADGELLRRLRRQLDHRRVLPLGGVAAVGAGRARVARRRDAADRAHRGASTTARP